MASRGRGLVPGRAEKKYNDISEERCTFTRWKDVDILGDGTIKTIAPGHM